MGLLPIPLCGPIESGLSIWWSGWDIWENANEEHVSSKIDEIMQNHPEDYET